MLGNNIKSIQYLRGIASIIVVLFHFRMILNESNPFNVHRFGDKLFANGINGVDLFFIISGFVIMLSTEKDHGVTVNSKFFALKRFFRIYPPLIIFVIAASIIKESTATNLFKSLIPLNLDYMLSAPFFGYNNLVVAWSLTFEIAFYAIFLISMAISHKYRGVICFFITLSLMCSLQLYYNGIVYLNPFVNIELKSSTYITNAIISIFSSPMMICFCLGILSFYAIKAQSKIKKISDKFRPVLLMVLVIFSITLLSDSWFLGHGPTKASIVSFALITLFVIYEKYYGLLFRPILSFLGDISYSLYLSHTVVLLVSMRHDIYFGMHGLSKFIYLVMVSLLLSYAVFILVEKPSIKLCRRLLK